MQQGREGFVVARLAYPELRAGRRQLLVMVAVVLSVLATVVVVHHREAASLDEMEREARGLRRTVDMYKYSTFPE